MHHHFLMRDIDGVHLRLSVVDLQARWLSKIVQHCPALAWRSINVSCAYWTIGKSSDGCARGGLSNSALFTKICRSSAPAQKREGGQWISLEYTTHSSLPNNNFLSSRTDSVPPFQTTIVQSDKSNYSNETVHHEFIPQIYWNDYLLYYILILTISLSRMRWRYINAFHSSNQTKK